MIKRVNMNNLEGKPLAVCINDCEIDYGQPGSDLAKVCVRLGCAFAEMRWGKSLEEAKTVSQKARPVKFFPERLSDQLPERCQR